MKDENLTERESSSGNGVEEIPRDVIRPSADIDEYPEAYVLTLELPGARKDAIALTLEGDVLEVHAEVGPHHRDGELVLHRELRNGAYHRVFTLGKEIDRNTVDAVFEDGVLTVKLFKAPGVTPRAITIH